MAIGGHQWLSMVVADGCLGLTGRPSCEDVSCGDVAAWRYMHGFAVFVGALSWRMRSILRFVAILLPVLPGLLACAGSTVVVPRDASRVSTSAKPPPVGGDFGLQQLAKTDIDRVADAERKEIFAGLQLLAEKLYRRNPAEWKKSGATHLEEALARLKAGAQDGQYAGLEGYSGVAAMQQAFREDFQGDRVLALVGGLGGMVHVAFNEKTEFFMTDDLDPQKLYNSARNVEIAVWRLSNARDRRGALLLLSNEPASQGQPANLSFEREFGKIIGQLDMLAIVVADKANRSIVKVLQSVATALFLPVGMVK